MVRTQTFIKLALLALLFLFALNGALANNALWPSVSYDPNIPGHSQSLGYPVGEKISSHGEMLLFFERLQKAAPDRLRIFEYGRSWEGRKLVYIVIGNPQNMANLDKLTEQMQQLADPRQTNANQAKAIIKNMPAFVWLEYAVHGNEISGTDAAMMTAYHLLAAPQDPVNQNILDNTLIFIDPLQNPDGRTRFTSRYYSTVGLMGSDDRLSAEHNEPWPNGRSNHYLFDLNRDWLALTQPESKAKVKAINQYLPLVVVDLHEMGGDSSYFFAPAAQPHNPHITKTQLENMALVGRNNAKHFDQFGFDYFTREVFDAFYPGYGDSWPIYYGAAASTYEVASSRGERYRNRHGETFTYRDTVQKHFVASIATIEAVADNRIKFLEDFYQFQIDTINQGKSNKERTYILPNQRDRAGNHRLATLMAHHGVEVQQATKAFKACGKQYQAGAYFIDTAQPRGRYVTTTLTQQVDMPKKFVDEQERRRARKLRDQIYDVTAWSLPLMFNIDTNTCNRAIKVGSIPVTSDQKLTGRLTESSESPVAYIVPWGDISAVRFLASAIQQGIKIKSADRAFTIKQRRYPAGSLIIESKLNHATLKTQLNQLATQSGALIESVDTSWVTDGPSFGSSETVKMIAPQIAMAWDEPTSSLSAGNSRFVIERQMGYPVTAIRSQHLTSANLARYQVLILPAGKYASTFGKSGAQNIKAWVERGGVLITLGSATKYASLKDVGLLNLHSEDALRDNKTNRQNGKKDNSNSQPGQLITDKAEFLKSIENDHDKPDYVAGILANVTVDQEHWLTAGVHSNLASLVYGNDIYAPIKLASGTNVAWFQAADKVLASGYLWPEYQQQLAFKPFLIHQPMGAGMVIGFTQDPTVRAYLDGLNVLFANTIFRAAAHATPLR